MAVLVAAGTAVPGAHREYLAFGEYHRQEKHITAQIPQNGGNTLVPDSVPAASWQIASRVRRYQA
mgnify:CR=1 FL=1